MQENVVRDDVSALLSERIERVDTAIALGTPDRVPIAPQFYSVTQHLTGSSYRDLFYDYRRAGEAMLEFFKLYPGCDAHIFPGFTSGRANELAGTSIIDWPGRPGTTLPDISSHQFNDGEYMLADEYPEFLNDFTGFVLRKYIPRVYRNLDALKELNLRPTHVMSTSVLQPFGQPGVKEALRTLLEIAEADEEAQAVSDLYQDKLMAMGMPPLITGLSLAPFDILGDYYRGTLGIFKDLVRREDMILKACELIADQQIEALQYYRFAPLPVKRCFFPLHKGMDGFMSPMQYEKLYWNPLKKVMLALIDMGVTPFIYSEGRYDSRLEQLADVPKGKVLYHFEDVDMARAKKIVGSVACISGNLSAAVLQYGEPAEVREYCKYLIDTCAPGGGYIFDTNAVVEHAKRENLDAIFETFELYGKY